MTVNHELRVSQRNTYAWVQEVVLGKSEFNFILSFPPLLWLQLHLIKILLITNIFALYSSVSFIMPWFVAWRSPVPLSFFYRWPLNRLLIVFWATQKISRQASVIALLFVTIFGRYTHLIGWLVGRFGWRIPWVFAEWCVQHAAIRLIGTAILWNNGSADSSMTFPSHISSYRLMSLMDPYEAIKNSN